MANPSDKPTLDQQNAVIQAFNAAIEAAGRDRFGARELEVIARAFSRYAQAVDTALAGLRSQVAALQAPSKPDET